jgi:hypothetical protein
MLQPTEPLPLELQAKSLDFLIETQTKSFLFAILEEPKRNDHVNQAAYGWHVRCSRVRRRIKIMFDWIWFVAFFAVYIVLMRWVLPRLGVRT